MRLLAAILLLLMAGPVMAKTVWKTLPFAVQCQEQESGADEGQDFVFHKCEGPAPVWLLYQDSTRLSVGFGANPHVSLQYMAPERGDNWPVQWGGQVRGGKFMPLVAIVRFKGLDQPASTLFVFRLLENGSSCVVGSIKAGANQSAEAKAIAEKAMTSWTCLSEPVPVTS